MADALRPSRNVSSVPWSRSSQQAARPSYLRWSLPRRASRQRYFHAGGACGESFGRPWRRRCTTFLRIGSQKRGRRSGRRRGRKRRAWPCLTCDVFVAVCCVAVEAAVPSPRPLAGARGATRCQDGRAGATARRRRRTYTPQAPASRERVARGAASVCVCCTACGGSRDESISSERRDAGRKYGVSTRAMTVVGVVVEW